VRDNGLIVNTVMQVTSTPERIAVTINKSNYSHDVIKNSKIMNVNCLSVSAPFKVFEVFGFSSGRDKNKFENCSVNRSDNGLAVLPKYINSYMSLAVEEYIDFGTHGMFVCSVTEAGVVSSEETMTYTYYHKNVKPQPKTEGKKGYVCKICGYTHEGPLPEDFICPWCKHPAEDFEKV
jgi:flavin reductase (DIM6/NTAB) family NADH-FMN oxidoreductase RutF